MINLEACVLVKNHEFKSAKLITAR